MKYNIAILMNGAKPPRGGEALTYYLIKEISRKIFKPILIYAVDSKDIKKLKKNIKIKTIKIEIDKKLTEIYPREVNLLNPVFIINFIYNLIVNGGIIQVARELRKENIKLIYCADNISKIIGGIAGKLLKIKVVGHCHDDFSEDILGKTMRFMYFIMLDKIIAVSKKVSMFFGNGRILKSKVVTIYNGIDAEIFNPDKIEARKRRELCLSDKDFIIGSIGQLEKDKGQKYLLFAIEKLKKDNINNIKCLICGEGPEEEKLKQLTKDLNIDKEVKFLGYRDDIAEILRIMDLMVITSLTIESFSIVAAEAMSMKVPVIATQVGGLPEVIEDGVTGILVPPAKSDMLKNAVKYLIEHPEIKINMGEQGRKKVCKFFNIKKNIKIIEELFSKLIKDKI